MQKQAFTLIELLVVIAIISILAALLSPALKKARDQARGIVCMSTLKQFGLAVRMYANEYDGYLPAGTTGTGYSADQCWGPSYAPYMGVKRDDPNWNQKKWLTYDAPGYIVVIRCPSAPKGITSSYGVHYGMFPPWPFTFLDNGTNSQLVKVDDVPAHCFLMSDATYLTIYGPYYSSWNFTYDADLNGFNDSLDAANPYNWAAPNRHNNGANYLFPDGHVKWARMKDWENNTDNLWRPYP